IYDKASSNAMMQRSKIILIMEDNLSDEKREEFSKDIREYENPYAEEYSVDEIEREDVIEVTFKEKGRKKTLYLLDLNDLKNKLKRTVKCTCENHDAESSGTSDDEIKDLVEKYNRTSARKRSW
ncbi:uncharacterized protein LOC144342488, partial [Saccoglossus kowalevskii]